MSESLLREALMLADAALSGANMNMAVVERKVKAAIAMSAIPEGYALVPIEPTAAIIEAGLDYAGKGLCRNEAVGRIVTAWRFMLEAAKETKNG